MRPAPLAPAHLGAIEKRRLFPTLRADGQCLKFDDEPRLAVVPGAHPAHSLLPLGRQPSF
jgi:hypothetical protein